MKLFIYIILTALASCVLSQTLKTFFNVVVRKKKFKLGNLVADGNYPSSHTSFTSSVTAISWIYTVHEYITKETAEISMWCSVALTVFLIVIIRDALGVRYTVQKLCDAVTKMSDGMSCEQEIKKLLDVKSGHRPHEVLAGAVLGIIIATFSSLIYYRKYSYIQCAIIAFVIYIGVSIVIIKAKNNKNTV